MSYVNANKTWYAVLLLAVLLCTSSICTGKTYTVSPDNYLASLKKIGPGDHLQLQSGEYKQGLPIAYLNGTSQEPIVISGPANGSPAILVARPGHNTVSIINSSYVTLRNMELDGRGLPVDGVKCEGHADWAHHITLEGLHIRGHGNNQQTVGISTKCPAWNWVIRRNVIEGAGTGMYFGNSDGRAPFIGGLIERNLIVDTIGYNLQIKHQLPRPALADMPDEKNVTIIRHNVFSKARGGSKEMARPNLLVGHWPLTGPGVDDQYFIYGNFFYQNPDESLFQGEGNFAMYNNLFVNHFGDAVRIQPHNDTPRKVAVFHNTVVARGAGITLARREHDPVYPQFVTANSLFANPPLQGYTAEMNLTGTFDEARDYLSSPFLPPGEMDLMPIPGKANQKVIDEERLRAYPEWDIDFDGRPHGGQVFGAYAADNGQPRWLPKLEIKPVNASR